MTATGSSTKHEGGMMDDRLVETWQGQDDIERAMRFVESALGATHEDVQKLVDAAIAIADTGITSTLGAAMMLVHAVKADRAD